MEPHCEMCDKTEQLVNTQDGYFCNEHYRVYKRGKSVGREVNTVRCGNCGEMTVPDRRCIRCGNTLTSTGEVIRIGGHRDC